jgi:putative two-component system response regulator
MKESPQKSENPFFVTETVARILVIDDDVQIQKLINTVLVPFGHQIGYASSAGEAQKTMVSFPPDLILLDYDLPGRNGVQLLAEIRAQQKYRFVPVIMMTGCDIPGLKLSAIKGGVTDFINKPFSHAELAARVQSLLKQKFLTDELEVAGNVLLSMAEIIEARDHYTCGHGGRVARYSELLAKRIGMDARQRTALRKGAFFHDIGKIAIRDDVLLKPGRLTSDEFLHIQIHPVKGYELLKGLKTMRESLQIVRHHHEKLDGSGYPDHLSGNSIPTAVRVASIADIYDALTTTRPYRVALSAKDALQIMGAEAKKGWWDPGLFAEFGQMLKDSPSPHIQAMTFSTYPDRATAVHNL